MSDPSPIGLGRFDFMKAGSILKQYIDVATDLALGEAIETVVFTVTDSTGAVVSGVVGNHTETATRTDFLMTAPTAGVYLLTAWFMIDDGQKFPKTATLWVV